jgi:hypothetical protein
MSDDENAPNGSGGHKPSNAMAAKVSKELFELVAELGDNRRRQISVETRITGLAHVIGRGVPFGPEQAEQVAAAIVENGDIDHERGSSMYTHAERIRRAANGG